MTIKDIADLLQQDLSRQIEKSGLMFRLFWRVKSIESIRHKMALKGEQYLSGQGLIKDII